LFPLNERRKLWDGVARCIALEFPQLKHTRTWRSRFMAASFMVATLVLLAGWIMTFRLWGVGVGIFSFFAAFIGWIVLFVVTDQSLIRWTAFLRDEIPVANAGDLARVVMGMNPSWFSSGLEDGKRLSKDLVWSKLVEIFCDQLQVERDEVVPDASIAEDLGVD
jgi:hypothetical protein